MKVAVAGLWHLGTVTAACCAAGGHDVIAFDDDPRVIEILKEGGLPVDEFGLADLIATGIASQRLHFTDQPVSVGDAEILWICYDTPVDDNDIADTEFVCSRVAALLPRLSKNALVLISSQLPVGSCARLAGLRPDLAFAYSPENLRLGKALDVFMKPDRVVIGTRGPAGRDRLSSLFAPFTDRIEWMSVESAEMTKHALNAFLATSIAFVNEVAALCEKTGADATEVERGLKTDGRIGSRAYLHAGNAFAGGTLARDIRFLTRNGEAYSVPVHLLAAVQESNSIHKLWAGRRISEMLGSLRGKTVAVLGLTYKAGTNTLRRSASLETCRRLAAEGARVQVFDPAITSLPGDPADIHLVDSPELALLGADAALIATPWPELRLIPALTFARQMRRPLVIDPDRYLEDTLIGRYGIEYLTIGASFLQRSM